MLKEGAEEDQNWRGGGSDKGIMGSEQRLLGWWDRV